ncbi:glycoside hydrolase family 88 protein [Aeromonas caviae]
MYLVLLFSLLMLAYELYPLFKKKLYKESCLEFDDVKNIEDIVSRASLTLTNSKKIKMSFDDDESLYSRLSRLKNKIVFNKKHFNYRYYNFPKAWLYLGVIEQYKKSGDLILLNSVIKQAEKLADVNGDLLFSFDKIDQSLFGVVFIELYILTNDNRFKYAADNIYTQTQSFLNKDGLILYRKNSNVYFVDTLGMVIPFLSYYAHLFKIDNARVLANRQLEFYIEHGLDDETKFPFHAIDMNNSMKLGSINWGRGLGWFLIGLSYSIKYSSESQNNIISVFNEIIEKLYSIRSNEKYWPQFLGHTDDVSIDSSATIMFYFSQVIASMKDNNVMEDLSVALKQSINKSGFVFNASGDTFYINKYSKAKSVSEVSQGLFLYILSKE